MYNPFSLEGKTILITGASSGIGRSTAIECSKLGASVILCGRNIERLEETINNLEGKDHSILEFDITNILNKDFISQIPNINGIVHSAGISQMIPVKFMNSASLKEIMDVNFIAPFVFNNSLIKNKKISNKGSIVFISSISGNIATQIGETGYGASKAALLGYIKGCALELATKGIRVNGILPGIIETPLLNKAFEKFSAEEINRIKKKYPLQRFGNPKDVALCAVFLLSDSSSFITGSNIVMDGGFSLS